MNAPVLLADVGASRVRFALARDDAAQAFDPGSLRTLPVARFASLDDAALAYLREMHERPRHAVFVAAGRLDGERVAIAHNPWRIHFGETREALGLERHSAINDFAAMSLGLPLLGPHDSIALGPAPTEVFSAAASQTFAVLGPDGGFGVGALLLREGRMFALQTEGGHVGVAPGDALEIEVLKVLQARLGRLSVERLLCGQGLQHLQSALHEVDARGDNPAHDGETPRRRRTLELFCSLLGATAGDFVLGFGAWQGVWLSGGLVPHLLPWLKQPAFRRRFEDKGHFAAAMRRVPVRVVLHPYPGLLGAAAQAMLDAGRSPLRGVAAPSPPEEVLSA